MCQGPGSMRVACVLQGGMLWHAASTSASLKKAEVQIV